MGKNTGKKFKCLECGEVFDIGWRRINHAMNEHNYLQVRIFFPLIPRPRKWLFDETDESGYRWYVIPDYDFESMKPDDFYTVNEDVFKEAMRLSIFERKAMYTLKCLIHD